MASDLSSGCMETIDILDDEKEEGEISLEDVSSSEEGGIGHLTCNYVISRTRSCPDCKSWGECAPWCTMMYYSKSRRDPVKGKENRHRVREAGCTAAKHTASTLQEKNDDLVPISSDSDMEIVGLTDTSNRSKSRMKKKKRKKKDYDIITIDDLISPASDPITDFGTLKKTHYRESSPVRRSGRSRVISRSPIRRHRSPVKSRSPIRSSRSPLSRVRSPMSKRSPRRLRSPKRISPHRSPVRSTRRPSRLDSSPSTRHYSNRHGDVTKLLKKVKHSMGILESESNVDRSKEHQSSLKEKLSNMLKKQPDNNDTTMRFKAKTNKTAEPDIVNDADDEEDLALLRQKALETKQKKSNKSSNHGQTDMELEKKPAAKNDDQDEEALQLRMIALRSAVMKKHQNRVRRGIRTNKKPSRSESPFSQSFLDDIPVPGDELLKFASPPCTPPCDSNRIEDMELDTDVEGEKEGELPYSPTDKITTHVPIDTSLLGIEPSDVSFINVNETNNKSPIFNDAERIEDVPLLTTDVASCYSNTYLTSHAYEASQYYAYSPSQQCTEIFLGSDLNDEPEKLSDHLRDCQSDNVVCDLIDGICCQVDSSMGVASTQHDVPDTHPIPVLTNLLPTPSISSKTQQQVIEQSTDVLFANVDSTFGKCTYEAQNISECPFRRTSPTMYAEPVSPNESIVTIDDFLETEKDSLGSSVVDKNLPTTDCIPKESSQAVEEETEEPLYMQGVPDITKDANKIPTLINKTLVPAPILRSNKQLQQPLPGTKKCETHVSEPSFKSAEMQPVTANAQNTKSGSNFKPIKLRVARKSAPILTASVAFNELTNENSENDPSEVQEKSSKDSSEIIEHFVTVKTVCPANNDVASARKKRKRKKELQLPFNRYKSFSSLFQLLVEKQNNSDDSVNKDVNIIFSSNVERQITESGPSEGNNDNKAQKGLMENEELKLQNAIGNQESVSFNNITIENKSVERSDLASTLSASAECPQERNVESHLSRNSASDNLDSNRAPKDTDNRRQSVDEDENELRAILLASMKRKLIDINNSPSTISITANCANSQKSIQKTLTDTTQKPIQKTLTDTAVINATHATMNNNAVSSTRLGSSQTEEKEINRVPSSLLVNGKKKINVDAKGPQKKMMRKSIIPASTKVVNNAKKYQNMMEQRRSNLRKFDNNTKPNENVWSNANPSKTPLHVSDTQRFVISLGSDTDSESDGEKRKDSVLVPTVEKHQSQDISADFEQSLHKFLRDMRKEQEQSTVANVAKSATTRDVPLVIKDSSNMHTPLAVRHLPASQQEEYRRLKQQILEREKLKLQRKVADNNNSANNNKLLNSNTTASSLVKSQSMFEKKNMHIKQNPDKSTESERNSQQLPTESKKRNINAAKNSVTSNASHTNTNKNLSINVVKPILNSNSEYSSTKEAKKTIPNNLSICITNEIAPNYTGIESRTVENSSEKQQNNRPALRALTKEEINRKYVQVLLKSDISGRIVTINDRSVLRHDITNVSQSEKPVGNDVSTEISEEKQRNNENNNNSSVFSNASTVKLLDLTTNSSMNKQEHEDFMMETTMPLSQYEAESQREMNRNTSTSLSSENNNSNNAFYKSDSVNVDNKGNTDDVWDALKKDVKEELDSLINLPKAEQERYLRDTEHKLVARRYTVLDHLAEMSGNLRQWDMEKELQNSLASEVKKLKEQLKMAEERLQLQRDRVNSMGPKVSTARQKINAGRRECFKLSKICSTLGNRLMGKIYKLPEAGGQLLSDKLKEVANHTRQFTKKKRIQFNDVPENSNSNFLREISESSKHTCIEDDLPLQEQPINDTANETGSKNDTCHLKQCSDDGNLFISESSVMLNLSQTFLNQLTPLKRKETITSLHNDEQVTPPNQDTSEPKLYQRTQTPMESYVRTK
ncbi:hypothetical protein EAG_13874 [Camponotus floridanus]|uniref:Uncharacterized protein n=1 Tax=Camponotus floridanus TaxID=104421 RepID=E2AZ48_CAMFO|nr:hypothetical protein EAG_13874 [Camponotus floridanus]